MGVVSHVDFRLRSTLVAGTGLATFALVLRIPNRSVWRVSGIEEGIDRVAPSEFDCFTGRVKHDPFELLFFFALNPTESNPA